MAKKAATSRKKARVGHAHVEEIPWNQTNPLIGEEPAAASEGGDGVEENVARSDKVESERFDSAGKRRKRKKREFRGRV